MTIRRSMGLGFLCAALAAQSAFAAPTWSAEPFDQCPLLPVTIEVLPEVLPFVHGGDTCKGVPVNCKGRKDECKYNSSACTIPNVPYPGNDVIYKVSLHEGNRVAFHLSSPVDLVLVLIKECGDGTTCVSNSTDFIGPHDEEIPEAHYTPGDYYLYVDSAEGTSCDLYTLTVTGVNPTPDLELGMVGSSETVVAGEHLTYTLTLRNVGKLDATNVEVVQTLPDGVTLYQEETKRCEPAQRREVLWAIGNLSAGAEVGRKIEVCVKPSTRDPLISSAVASAKEGDPDLRNNSSEVVRTAVIAKSALSIEKHSASSHSVAAGQSKLLTYTLRIKNDGPSDATTVKVTDDLPDEVSFESFVKAPRGCRHLGGTIQCSISRIANDTSVDVSFRVKVKPSARDSLINKVEVDADEKEPEPKPGTGPKPSRPIRSEHAIDVTRETDLSITKSARPELVAAGGKLTYTFTVHNAVGPSDSSGAKLRDTLPLGLTFSSSSDDCHEEASPPGAAPEPERVTVICDIGPVVRDPVEGVDVAFTAKVASSMSAGTRISNTARITGNEPEPVQGGQPNTSNTVETVVKIEADLRILEIMAEPIASDPPVRAGENLLYKIKVENLGPSNSRGGEICATLPGILTFVASPDGCSKGNTMNCSGPGEVSCLVPPLLVGKSFPVRFVAAVSSGFTEQTIEIKATVTGIDEDPIDNNTIDAFPTDVKQEADLAVAVEAKAEEGSGKLVYTLTVTNRGPSEAADATLTLKLPEGSSFDVTPSPECLEVPPDVVKCELQDLPFAVGAQWITNVGIIPPGSPDTRETAKVSSSTPDDRVPGNNTATLPNPGDADLAVTKRAGVKAVVPGDLLQYTIEVVNHGPGDASLVRLEDELPGGVMYISATFTPEAGGSCTEIPETSETPENPKARVSCDLSDPLKEDEKRTIVLTVKVKPDSTAKHLTNTARIPTDVSDAIHDPNKSNDESAVITPVLHTPPLILPFFEVTGDVTTHVALMNPSEAPVMVDYKYTFSGGPAPVAQSLELSRKATHSEDIGAVPGFPDGDRIGYVGITPSGTEPPVLSGDFIRSEIRGESEVASGLPLVSTDTSRVPSELCRRWSVRFLNGHSPASRTEFLFFVPGNRGETITGRVYNESGDFVQEISITDESEESFRKTTEDEPVQGLDLLANFGSIEWELPEEVVGNVSAVHKVGRQYAVAVPGFCRDGELGSGSPLIVPYFEVNQLNGINTFLAVRNETADPITVGYKYISSEGAVLLEQPPLPLDAHATQRVNLDVPELRGKTGFVQIEPSGKASGDFVWIDTGRGASGGALVDTSLDRSPRQLCQYWDARLVRDKAAGAATDFVFYVNNPNKAMLTGRAYGCGPMPPVEVQRSLKVSAPPDLEGSCFIEWDFPDGVVGHVGTIFTTGGKSPVFVPGVCRQP